MAKIVSWARKVATSPDRCKNRCSSYKKEITSKTSWEYPIVKEPYNT